MVVHEGTAHLYRLGHGAEFACAIMGNDDGIGGIVGLGCTNAKDEEGEIKDEE